MINFKKNNLTIKEGDTVVMGIRHHVKWITSADFPSGSPVLVFLHEGLGSIGFWKDFPEILCSAMQCSGIVYDRRGYGKSDFLGYSWSYNYHDEESIILLELLKEWGAVRPILIGHSDGGTIALLAAAKENSDIYGIITEAAHVVVEEITIQGIEIFLQQADNFIQKLAQYHGNFAEIVLKRWAARWLSPEYRSWKITDKLPNVSCPLLALQGEADEYGTIIQLEKIVAGVSGEASLEMIPNCGHVPHHQNREHVLNSMAIFIQNLL